MSIRRLVRIVAFTAPALALVAFAATLILRPQPTEAGAGVDFSMAVSLTQDGANICDSGGASTCVIPGETDAFTIKVLLNDRADNTYFGYDAAVEFTTVQPGGVPTTASTWPDCGFPAAILANAKLMRMGCAAGIGVPASSYTGALARTGGVCVSGGGTLTLRHGSTETALDGTYFEAEGTTETLTITCGGGGGADTPTPTTGGGGTTPTNTQPSGGSATSTLPPTNTRTPTRTPTRTNTQPPQEKTLGDVNDDGNVNSMDALLVLELAAGMRSSLINEESADMNGDGEIDPIDSLHILWIEADLI